VWFCRWFLPFRRTCYSIEHNVTKHETAWKIIALKWTIKRTPRRSFLSNMLAGQMEVPVFCICWFQAWSLYEVVKTKHKRCIFCDNPSSSTAVTLRNPSLFPLPICPSPNSYLKQYRFRLASNRLTWQVLYGIPRNFQWIVGIPYQLGHDRFHLHPIQFVIHPTIRRYIIWDIYSLNNL
jgi:hypothetical protein